MRIWIAEFKTCLIPRPSTLWSVGLISNHFSGSHGSQVAIYHGEQFSPMGMATSCWQQFNLQNIMGRLRWGITWNRWRGTSLNSNWRIGQHHVPLLFLKGKLRKNEGSVCMRCTNSQMRTESFYLSIGLKRLFPVFSDFWKIWKLYKTLSLWCSLWWEFFFLF